MVADDDGVVIVRRSELARVVEASRARADLEEQKASLLVRGEMGLNIYNIANGSRKRALATLTASMASETEHGPDTYSLAFDARRKARIC